MWSTSNVEVSADKTSEERDLKVIFPCLLKLLITSCILYLKGQLCSPADCKDGRGSLQLIPASTLLH